MRYSPKRPFLRMLHFYQTLNKKHLKCHSNKQEVPGRHREGRDNEKPVYHAAG